MKNEEIKTLAEKIYVAGFAGDIPDPRKWAEIAIESAREFCAAWEASGEPPNPKGEIEAAALLNKELQQRLAAKPRRT